MVFENIFSQLVNLTSSFNSTIAIILFLICSIGELKFPVPFLLESIWLLAGYNISIGRLSFFDILLLWIAAQIGRQIGATALYNISKFGSIPLIKFYEKNFKQRKLVRKIMSFKIFDGVRSLSPFSVALGRLIGLRIPITLTLGVQRKLRTLLLGVVLSSIIFDGLYVSLGFIFHRTASLEPLQIILYSLFGITVLYIIGFIIRYRFMGFFKRGYDKLYFSKSSPNFIRKWETKSLVKIIKQFVVRGDLLDIGCGDGLFLNELKKDFNVYGIDISEFGIKASSRFVDRKRLKMVDIEKDDIKDKYDIILALSVLEHMKNPRKIIIKIRNALRKNGIFVFCVPNNYGVYGKITTKFSNYIDKTHISTLSRKKWLDLMKEQNFNILQIINGTPFGLFRSDWTKYIASALIVIVKK